MKHPDHPKVTVLMTVFNGERYLRESIESILNQSFTDFEFLIIDDGSTDNSKNIIESYEDHRIRLIQNDKNFGLISALNKGIDLSRGEYIARMDCDDISLPKRLINQVNYMDYHPDISVCGTWFRHFGISGGTTFFLPTKHEDIKCGFLFYTAMAHPSVIIRKKMLLGNNLYYNPAYKNAEDYELWVRSLKYLKYHNIGKVLLHYRLHERQIMKTQSNKQLISTRNIWRNQLSKLMIDPEDKDLDIHQSISTGNFNDDDADFLARAENWLYLLLSSNKKSKFYSDKPFEYLILERWFKCCYKAYGHSIQCLKRFFNSSIVNETKEKNILISKLFLKTIYYKSRSIYN